MKKLLYGIIISFLLIGCDKLNPKPKSIAKQNAGKAVTAKRLQEIKNNLNVAEIISDKDFSLIIVNRAEPAAVLFYTKKSAPSILQKKIFETLSTNQIDNILFAEVDLLVPSAEPIGAKNSVFSLPTIILFKNGKEVDRIVGKTDINTLKALIKK